MLADGKESSREHKMISHFTYLLRECATILPCIAQYEAENRYPVWDACGVKFTTDFRALHGFMLAPLEAKRRDAHRRDYAPDWKPTWTPACQRLGDMTKFIHKHRAHLSWDRVDKKGDNIENWVPAAYLENRRLTATSYARILSDYLDILDEFIRNLPTKSPEQQLFFSAGFDARSKVNEFLGLPSPDPTPPWPLRD